MTFSGNIVYLNIKTKLNNVIRLHKVIAALVTELACLLGLLPTSTFYKIGIGDNLSHDKAPLKIGVNDASGLRGGGTDGDSPGSGLFDPSGVIGLKTESLIGLDNQPLQT